MSRGPQGARHRKILFIAYHFPPSAAVGGQRVANFAGVIGAFGWSPRVLTIADSDVERPDPARVTMVKDVPTDKVAVRRTVMDRVGSLWNRRPRRQQAAPPAATMKPTEAPPVPRIGGPTGWRRFVLSFMALPDWERGWILPAITRGVRIIRKERIDWIVTSCPPYSVHVVGLAVKIITGRRWVADFRDPWMTTGSKRLYPTSAASLRIERWLERQTIQKADLVVFNVDRLRDAYRARYHWVPSEKFVFIPNGIAATPAAEPVAKDDVFTIAYTGSLYVGRSPEPVLQAVARLMSNGTIPAGRIRVRLVGQCDIIGGVPAATVVARYGLESVVDVQAPVPYKEAFDIIRRSHLALLLAPNLPYQIPAKVYDYLGAGTRMLAIAEEGGTADLLAETSAGETFSADDIEGIAAFIAREFAAMGSPRPPATALARYDVRRITQDLVDHLTRVEAQEAHAS